MYQKIKRAAAHIWLVVTVALCCPQGNAKEELELYARSAVLMDGDSGRILYGKEADTPLPMASTTKIMTCILALEQADLQLECSVSKNAAAQPKVKLGMMEGDQFYLKDLLYSLMLESHNDTAVCIAENVGGSVEEFSQLMNQKAKEIGCTDTYYITPNGLDREDETGVHHTTARELALVMRYCLCQSPQKADFLEITGTASYAFTNKAGSRSYSCTNHNTLLSILDGALSGKTGFTGNAGYCYVGAVKKEDRLLIISLLACGWPNNKGYKWADTKKLVHYGIEYFTPVGLVDPMITTKTLPVENGRKAQIETIVDWEHGENRTLFGNVLLRQKESTEAVLQLEESLEAPVEKGRQVGTLQFLAAGEIYAQYPVLTAETVGKQDCLFWLRRIFEVFLL